MQGVCKEGFNPPLALFFVVAHNLLVREVSHVC